MTQQALVVIDLQRGAFDGARIEPVDAAATLIGNACALVQAARDGAHAVVFVQHGEDEAGSPFEAGTPHWQLHDRLQPAPGDAVLHKRVSSAFDDTDLDARLRAAGVTALVLCGLQSEHCVSNTARSALARGYAVQVAQDGHGTWPWDGKAASAIRAEVDARLAADGAQLVPTAALAAALRGGSAL